MNGHHDHTMEKSLTSRTSYKIKLWLFALLGYFVVASVVLILVAFLGGMAWLATYSAGILLLLLKNKFIFIVLPLIWVLARALWVKMEAPQGYELSRERYTVLFDQIDELSRQLKAPKIDQVVLTNELNAAVTQIPRLGIFGWNRTYLILGLELLLVLSPNQAKAVIAHELGHLSGNHSRFNGWIYRVRQTWYQVMMAFHYQNNLGANLMKTFFNWYYPQFNRYSFALARQNEYEADEIAVELTSQQDVADALINVNVATPYVDKHYWKSFFKLADFSPYPKQLPWVGLSHFLKQNNQAKSDLRENLKEFLTFKATDEDTHPALADRLRAIGVDDPAVPELTTDNAAEVWFADHYQATLDDFDETWLSLNEAAWKERYQYAVKSKEVLRKLQSKDSESLSDDDLWQWAMLTEEFVSEEAAEPLYRHYQQRYPDNPEVAFALGRLAYERKDEELLSHMRVALQSDRFIIDACQYAYFFLIQQGREQEATWWQDRASDELTKQDEDQKDRSQLQVNDPLIPHQLNRDLIQHLSERLQQFPTVKKAWVAKKVTKHYPDYPAIAIAVELKVGWFANYEKLSEEIYQHLQLEHTIYVVPLAGDYKKLAKRIRKHGEQVV